jgi:diguanylate cyclase (GGDEF)-like protein
MDTSTFPPLAWFVAAQFALYALGWGLFSLILRDEREAVAHFGGFLLLMGLGFVLASGRGPDRAWIPYVGANIVHVVAYAVLHRGVGLFMRIPSVDRELLLTVALVTGALLLLGPGEQQAPWRVVLTYGTGIWMLGRVALRVAPAARAEFGLRPYLLATLPAWALIAGFAVRLLRQLVHWPQPLEMQSAGHTSQALLLANLAAAAMFNFSFMAMVIVRLVAKLRDQARQDPLTGLPNRRALEHDLQRQWRRLQQGQGGFAVLALDLDHFKRVNDRYGHLAGDAVLEEMGHRLRAAVRAEDTVARTGGEEFVVLMPAASADGAQRTAQRLIDAVRDTPFDCAGERVALTVSVGVALARAADTSTLQVMNRADEALYRAKAEGRNRLVAAAA